METHTILPPWGDDTSRFRMIDVGEKPATPRRAVAEGTIRMSESAYFAIKEKRNPKGDVLSIAEVAGILAAKNTPSLIPLCHPLPIESVRVRCLPIDESFSVTVQCEVSTTAKTGVEMEALCGVNGALLAIYDLSKAVDPTLTISNIRLNIKEGGKSGTQDDRIDAFSDKLERSEAISPSFSLAMAKAIVITLSDRAASQNYLDSSGPLIADFLKKRGATILENILISDDPNKLTEILETAIENKIHLIITTGGTGLGPRDCTPETIASIADKEIQGIGETLRLSGSNKTKMAWLSRSGGWIAKSTLIIALPGNPKAVSEGLEVLDQLLPHALHTISGGDHG